MKIEHLSVSRMDTFNKCPYKYRLRYHDHVRTDKTFPAAEFGKWIHKGLELKVQNDIDVQEALKSCVQDYDFPSSYLKRVGPILRHFHSVNKDLAPGVTEFEFNLDVGAPAPMVGVIDRMIEQGDRIFVMDYKTGSFEKNKKQLRTDPQLMAYAFAAHTLTGIDYKKIDLALFYLMSGNVVPASFTEAQITPFVEELRLKIHEILQAEAEKAKPKINTFCKWCEYQCDTYLRYKALRNK